VSLNQWLLQAVSERLGAEGFVDRLMSKLNGLVNVAAFEERSVTTMKVSRLLLGAQEEIGGPIQLAEPDGKQLLNWTSIDVKEAQRA
jgi:hypothetical protein